MCHCVLQLHFQLLNNRWIYGNSKFHLNTDNIFIWDILKLGQNIWNKLNLLLGSQNSWGGWMGRQLVHQRRQSVRRPQSNGHIQVPFWSKNTTLLELDPSKLFSVWAYFQNWLIFWNTGCPRFTSIRYISFRFYDTEC